MMKSYYNNDIQTSKDLLEVSLNDSRIFQRKFLEQRKVFLWGVVNEESSRDVINRLLYLESEAPGKEITLFINSPGGSVTAGMAIYDAMQMVSSPVATTCVGFAASMGAVLLIAGQKGKRQCWPSAEVMIHQPLIGGYFMAQASDLEITAEQIERTKQKLAEIIAEGTGQPLEKIQKDFDRDYWMDAKESLEYGAIDAISEKITMT